MPRPNIFEVHKEGERWKKALLDGVDPVTGDAVTQRYIAAQLGITEQAVGQHKRNLTKAVKEKAAQKLVEKPQVDLIDAQAELVLDEMELIQKNIVRLEKVIGPVYTAISVLLKNVQDPEEIFHGMTPHARSNIALLRGLLVDSNKLLESLLRMKADIAPEVYAEERKAFLNQIQQINDFLFENNPELLDQYEEWLTKKKEEVRTN